MPVLCIGCNGILSNEKGKLPGAASLFDVLFFDWASEKNLFLYAQSGSKRKINWNLLN